MPHLPIETKSLIKQGLVDAKEAGELTYEFTYSAIKFWNRSPKRYLTICIIVGSFVCALLEFYRQLVARYEDKKIAENGNAYDDAEGF